MMAAHPKDELQRGGAVIIFFGIYYGGRLFIYQYYAIFVGKSPIATIT